MLQWGRQLTLKAEAMEPRSILTAPCTPTISPTSAPTDNAIRARIRAALPLDAFQSDPLRALWIAPLIVAISMTTVALVVLAPPWYVGLPLSFVLGNLYGSMMFFGHELAHGGMIRKRWPQELLLYPCCAIFCLSPHLWRVWHHASHHAFTNRPDKDSDNFGSLETFLNSNSLARALIRFAPGSRSLLSCFFWISWFTLHAQFVLWYSSRHLPGYAGLRRLRAALDSFLMAAFWLLLSVEIGWEVSLFAIWIPMLIANLVVLAYVATNHMVRPLSDWSDTLRTTMGVTTIGWGDRLHFHFSHHVEHHLFPAMPSRYYPMVRQFLMRHYGDHYLAPPHWWALVWLLRTPRLYADHCTLVDPRNGDRLPLFKVELALRNPPGQALVLALLRLFLTLFHCGPGKLPRGAPQDAPHRRPEVGPPDPP
jgi:fatty acid desaturase